MMFLLVPLQGRPEPEPWQQAVEPEPEPERTRPEWQRELNTLYAAGEITLAKWRRCCDLLSLVTYDMRPLFKLC